MHMKGTAFALALIGAAAWGVSRISTSFADRVVVDPETTGSPAPEAVTELVPAGKAAPNFSGKLSNGAAFSLSAATKTSPVFVYFIAESCPVTDAATPYYNRLATAYKALGLQVVGVINADNPAGWIKSHKPTFPILADGKYKVIEAYGVERGPTSVLIGKGGKIVKSWDGWSRGYVQELGSLSARALGKSAVALDLKGAPTQVEAG